MKFAVSYIYNLSEIIYLTSTNNLQPIKYVNVEYKYYSESMEFFQWDRADTVYATLRYIAAYVAPSVNS